MSPEILRLIADNEQDRAQARQWWRDSSDDAKLAVFDCISRTYDDPAMEVMSRFAQLAFCELAEEDLC